MRDEDRRVDERRSILEKEAEEIRSVEEEEEEVETRRGKRIRTKKKDLEQIRLIGFLSELFSCFTW
jgi:hypothetical protein